MAFSEPFQEAPTDFAINLLQWFKDQFDLNDDDVKALVDQTTEWVPTGCTKPGSIGCHCCPY